MKAVYIEAQGGPEVLTYGVRPDPVIGDEDVLVRVRAAAVNRFDLNARSGENKVRVPLPRILGEDLAGDVVEVGVGALDRIQAGTRVLVDPVIPCWRCPLCQQGRDEDCENRIILGSQVDGSYAELVAVPARNVYPIPDSLSYEDAAAIPVVFKTAWRLMLVKARLQPGETVLIHAAGGGVGTAALQIARFLGCRAIATAGADWKLERARELGADLGVNYSDEAWPEMVLAFMGGRGLDVVVDSVGASLWEGSFRCLARQGRFVTCGVTSGHRVPLHLGQLFVRGLSIMGVGGWRAAEFATVMHLVQRGVFKGVVARSFPLKEAAAAHALMESRNLFGKIVLVP
ncbi:MAG: zinc-binding dehydrogenase [Chloroflexi bacterium]|nr:zinc-binding dehydrogenase [Chloroflexota bacterium]